MSAAPGKPPTHWFIRTAGTVLAIAATVSIIASMRSNWASVRALDWSPALAATLAAYALLTMVNTLNASAVWTLLLPRGSLSVKEAYRILAKTQLLKYAFGNVFHFVGRAHLARVAGIAAGRIALSLLLEIVIVLAASSLVAIPAAVLLGPDALGFGEHSLPAARLVVLGVALIVVAGAVAALTPPGRRVAATAREHLTGVAVGIATNILLFIVTGVLIRIALRIGWPGSGDVPVWKLTSGFCLAWVLGYVTPGAPGGIGIREGVFLLLLGPELGAGVAVTIAVLFRLASVGGEILGYLTTFVLGPARRVA